MMKIQHAICIALFLFTSCKNASHNEAPMNQNNNAVVANEFVDALYSFNQDSLASILSLAQASQPNILYYQTWAKCGHYEIVKRGDYIQKNDSVFVFPVTVKDDLMSALQINFNVTDTFHITIRDGKIRSVENSSNDPDTYYEAKAWVKKNRPEYVEKACEGIWNGGPTPCECIQGMIKGFAEFVVRE